MAPYNTLNVVKARYKFCRLDKITLEMCFGRRFKKDIMNSGDGLKYDLDSRCISNPPAPTPP